VNLACSSLGMWFSLPVASLFLLYQLNILSFPVVGLDMALRGMRPSHPHSAQPSLQKKASIDAIEFYEDYVPEPDKAKMIKLEEEVRQIRYFHDGDEVEAQVGSFIPDLGCTRTRNSNFYKTLELYWHTKTMVAMGMLPEEQDFHQLKSRKEALEIQNAYVYEVIIWMANRHGGSSVLPAISYVWAKSSKTVSRREVVNLTISQVQHDK
jgi:hypothetical protein